MRFPFLLLCLGLASPNLLTAQIPSAKPVPKVQAVPQPHHITSFQLEGRELTACHYDPTDHRVFWHPILASRDLNLVRMGHPHDPLTHSHHNGVWVSHNSVNGLDFWGDYAKNQGRIVNFQVPREAYEDGDDFASMRMINHWVSAADNSIQLIETRRTEIRPITGAASWFMIIDMEFAAPSGKPAFFGPSGFGLVGVRMAKSIGVHDGGGRILNSEGLLNEKAVFRQPARWCDYSGRIANTGDEGFAGITLMNHPSNPSHPTAFHVRDDGWMCACLNLDKPLEVTDTAKLRVRYGLWVHDGAPDQAKIDSQWEAFAALPLTDLAPPKKK